MKKIVSLVLFAAMLVSLFVFPTSAAAWNGTDVSASLKGEGTAAKPYLVETAADLAFLAKSVSEGTDYSGKYITQTADIDLGNKEWKAIGDSTNSFKGVYDGKNFKITNLSITSAASKFTGLFGYVCGTETVSAGLANINVSGAITLESPQEGVGGLVGWIYKDSATMADTYVVNCVVDVDITITKHANQARIGGVAGYCFIAKMENVVNNGNVTLVEAAAHTRVGGFVGQGNRTDFVNCVQNGKITVNTTANVNVGGYIGMARTNKTYGRELTFTNCVNNGDITCVGTKGSLQIGGIVGGGYADDNNNALIFKNCLNTADLSGTLGESSAFPYVGGILSQAAYNKNCAIENCVNTGAMTSTGGKGSRAGGIVGVLNKAGQTTVYAKDCTSVGKWAGYAIADHDAGGNTQEVEVAVANTAAKKITNAIAPSATNIGGFATGYVKPVTPTGDASVALVLIALFSLAGVVVVKKVSAR